MKILNLYAGIGGNRKLWGDEHEVVAVEWDKEIAKIYQDFFPNDKVIICDAHKLLTVCWDFIKDFDFIWSSPPCPSHSQFRYRCGVLGFGHKPLYPNMKLYEEIIFLKYHFKGKYVVENVEPYYKPLIRPYISGRHYFWSNFIISNVNIRSPKNYIREMKREDLQQYHGVDISKYKIKDKDTILRNCVHPKLGLHIFKEAFKVEQKTLSNNH